jgi:hypothetical protein
MSHALLSMKRTVAPAVKAKSAPEATSKNLGIGKPDDVFEREADRAADEVTAAGALHNLGWSLSKMNTDAPLQRKCACGSTPGPTGECEACKKKRLGLQTKLAINHPGDIYEQEADRIADQVMAAPPHSRISGVGRRIQRFSGQSNGHADAAPASVDQALASRGSPLESVLRQDMEQRFGHDFSRVRVHSDAAASQSALDVNAHAYTVGNNIVFGAGRFAPGTRTGQHLLAHELTHVTQQPLDGASHSILRRSPAGTSSTVYGQIAEQIKRDITEIKRELVQAHGIYRRTGKIPETKYRLAPIEIKKGSLMSRSERYDAMAAAMGKGLPSATRATIQIDDITYDNRDPDYLTKEELRDEFWEREKKEYQACGQFWPKNRHQCQRAVDEKYGGESFKAWRDGQERAAYYEYQRYQEKVEAVASSGPISLVGRGIGTAIGTAIGGKKGGEKGGEIGAFVGGVGDVALPVYAGSKGGPGGENSPEPEAPVAAEYRPPPEPANPSETQPNRPPAPVVPRGEPMSTPDRPVSPAPGAEPVSEGEISAPPAVPPTTTGSPPAAPTSQPGTTGTRHLPREFKMPTRNGSDFPETSVQVGTSVQRIQGRVRARGERVGPGEVGTKATDVPGGRSGTREHWNEHGHEFPEYSSARQYVQGAIDFCRAPTTYRFYYRYSGRPTIGYYDPATNTFAATSVDGRTIYTYFRPDDVMAYVRNIRTTDVPEGTTPRHSTPVRQN